MYTSVMVVTPPAPRDPVASRSSRLLSGLHGLGLAAALVAYLGCCVAAGAARRVVRSAITSVRGILAEQRRVRRMLVTAGILGAAVVLGVSASGSTLALWNRTTPVGAITLSTGSTSITVNGSSSYTVPGLATTQLLPGLSAVSPQVLTITNTGTTALSIVPGATVFGDPSSLLAQNSNLAVSLFQSTNCAQSVDGSSAAAWTTAVVVASGASITACLQMTLSATAPSAVQALSATFTVPIVGTQVRNNS